MSHFELMLSLINPYDYKEYEDMCIKNNIESYSWPEYVYRMLTIFEAKRKYPETLVYNAYLQVIKDNGNTFISSNKPQLQSSPTINSKPCGGCGGGEVR